MRVTGWAQAALLGVALLLGADPAEAQGSKQESKEYFKVAVKSYRSGQFLAAGQAFVEAHKLFPRPEIAFSIGQAFRRQFQIDDVPRHLQVAVFYYRQYLAEVKKGGRRLEAVRGLSELTPHMARLGVEEMTRPPDVAVATSITISSISGAVVVLDDGPPRAVPFSREVESGPHKVVVMATGYRTEERQVPVAEGRLVALDVPLQSEPALLTVAGAEGAEVTVDGRTSGTTPLPRPLPLSAGPHFVTVTADGHRPYAEELRLERGATTSVTVSLPETDQRVAAHTMLGLGLGGIAAGAVLVVVAELKESEAESVREAQAIGTITEAQRIEHNEAVAERDDFALAAGITAAAGAGLAVTSLFLYLIDQPKVAPPADDGAKPGEPERDDEAEPDLELLAAPVLHPGMLGVGVGGRF